MISPVKKFFTYYFLKITHNVAQGWPLGFRKKLLSTSIDSPYKPREVHGLSEGKELAQRRAAPVLLCAMVRSPTCTQGRGSLFSPAPAEQLTWALMCPAHREEVLKAGGVANVGIPPQRYCCRVHGRKLQSEPEDSPCSAIPKSIIPRGNQRKYLRTFVLQVLFPVLFLTKEKPNLKRKKKEQFISVTLFTQASTLKHRF